LHREWPIRIYVHQVDAAVVCTTYHCDFSVVKIREHVRDEYFHFSGVNLVEHLRPQ